MIDRVRSELSGLARTDWAWVHSALRSGFCGSSLTKSLTLSPALHHDSSWLGAWSRPPGF
ncbi:hypothetical protein QF036_003386 [Arthrobacter globiformis]|nr:hypothetical protein [Arthrobacter globiformis]